MLEALILGAALGLVAGLAPGPFVAFVAATALQHGLRAGLKVALAPLAVETTAMLVTLAFLSQVPNEALRWVGLAGGAAIAALGIITLRRARGRPMDSGANGDRKGNRSLVRLIVAGLLSPSPWVFWTAVGGPLVLRQWRQGPERALVLYGTFLAFFVGSQMLVAYGAARGGLRLAPTARRWLMRGVGMAMVAAGATLAWLAWNCNLQQLVQTQQAVQERLR
jgi:threonine/homoserine/homoserine lactone efflux protein